MSVFRPARRSARSAILIAAAVFLCCHRASGQGQITFQTTDSLSGARTLWRIAAQSGATPENLSSLLDGSFPCPATSPCDYGPITVSPDGQWYVFQSERFSPACNGGACLSIVASDLSSGESPADVNGVFYDDAAQAAAGGAVIVMTAGGGPHTRDLFVVQKVTGIWQSPVCITTASTYDWNTWPQISLDSTKVAFNCSTASFPSDAVCEVGLDGNNFQVLVTKDDVPPGYLTSTEAHSGAIAPDGSVVFEAEWATSGTDERIWRRPAAGGAAALVNATYDNDNSPNVLYDGRIVSLWLNSSTGSGLHEIKVMDSSGLNAVVLTAPSGLFQEVDDIGIGCGPTRAAPVKFYTIAPCRLIDTRKAAGTYGGPALAGGGATRDFPVAGQCGVASDARAISANVTVVGPSAKGDLRIYPAGLTAPSVSSINFNAGQTRANNAILPLSAVGGTLTVQSDIFPGTTHLLFDIDGYFR